MNMKPVPVPVAGVMLMFIVQFAAAKEQLFAVMHHRQFQI
jgi:hypothetical protein